MTRQLALRLNPLVAFYEVDKREAEHYLIEWRHPLHLPSDDHPEGRPYTRPFGRMAFVMEDHGRVAAVVILASTVNTSVSQELGLNRYNTVDLARIGRSPDRRDQYCLRAVLRLTREYLVELWLGRYADWDARSAELCGGTPQIVAVSSSSLPGTPGDLYRFDGWTKVRTSKGDMGTPGRQKPSAANEIADGAKGLWVYSYPEPITLAHREAVAS